MVLRTTKLLILFLLFASVSYGAAIQGKEEGSVVGYCKSIDFVGGSQTLTSSGLDCTLESTAGASGGDVTSVGDCSGGACLDGTSDGGTNILFYDAQGATTLQGGDTSGAVTLTLPTTSGTLIYSGGAFHDSFSDYVANEHIDWTIDQGATNIHAGNYTDTDTTYTAGDALTLTGTDFDFDGGATPSGDLGGTWASPTVTWGNIAEGELANDSILEADLKAVDAPVDEECLTYESTTGDFEWQSCGSGGGATTDGGATTYVTSATDDFAIGGTDSTAPFFFDESDEKLTLSGAGVPFTANNTSSDTWNLVASLYAPNLTSGEAAEFILGKEELTKNRGSWMFHYDGSGSNNNYMAFTFFGVSAPLTIMASTNVGINNASPTESLDVTGNIAVSGTVDGIDIAARDHDAVTLAGTPDYITLSGQVLTRAKLDITDDTNLIAGTNLTLSTNTLSVDDAFLSNTGDVGTGTFDFGGADDLEIPNGASPTVDTAGQVAVDTTSDQLIYYGGAKRVLTYFYEKGFTLESPTAGDDNVPFWHPKQAITITDVYCETEGGTSAGVTISDGTNALEEVVCDADGQADDGTITNGAFTANERMEFDIGTVTGTVDWVSVTITYTINAD